MKKCPKCGSRIREGSAFCVNCGAKLSRGKYAKKSARKSHKLLLIMVILVVIIAMIAMGILIRHNTKKNVSLATESEVTIIVPDDLSIEPEDVYFENQRMFVDSQLLLKVQIGTSYEEVEELITKENGVIIGYISFSGDYHIDFPDGKTHLELEAIQQKWTSESFIDSVSFNQVFLSSTSAVDYANDPWKETWFLGGIAEASERWTEGVPNGNNWWAEAIYMPSVWEMDLWDSVEKGAVNVGVIDSVFAPNHKDLNNVISKTWNNSFDENNIESSALSHGTHVSGIIAAELGNNVGIAGVASCVEPKLFCYAMHGKGTEVYGSTMEYKYAIALLLEEGVEIINISMGFNDAVVFAAEQGNTIAQEIVTSSDESLSIFLHDALSAGYDFLIVKSAGNTSNDYFVECGVTEETPFGYRVAEPNEAGAISARCSANWNLFAGIQDAAVRDRIIIVGAAQKTKGSSGNVYVAADFSNNDCDVYAPGVDILSLAYGDKDTVSYPGTSQATPIITGIATLLKATNPNISSVQIKEIILKSVPNLQEHNSVAENQVSIVNAAVAVYYGRGWSTSEGEDNRDSAILGTVYEIVDVDGEEKSYGITNATISIYSQNQNDPVKVISTQETDGGFNGYFTAGNYSVSVEAEGYIKHTSSFALEENDVIYLSIQLLPEKKIEKKLTQANGYFDNSHCWQENLKYNDDGLLTRYTTDSYSTTGENHYAYSFAYNDNGQLIQSTETTKGYPCTKYNYSSDGQMVGWSYWEYSTTEGEITYVCEYNASGQRIRDISSDGTNETVYTYDDKGRVIVESSKHVYGDMSGTTAITRSYDNAGNLSEQTVISDWGFGDPSVEKTVYNYDYKPFTLVSAYSDGNQMYSNLVYEDTSADEIISFIIDDSAQFESQNGSLSRVTGDDYTYEFFYDGDTDESFASKIPARRYEDEITGDYISDYTDVKITITATNSSDYRLTYTASGVTLENIPLAYFNENTSTRKMIMFDVDAMYPDYSGYIEFVWGSESIFGPYSFNALIDGLAGTEGDYYPLKKVGVFIPAN